MKSSLPPLNEILSKQKDPDREFRKIASILLREIEPEKALEKLKDNFWRKGNFVILLRLPSESSSSFFERIGAFVKEEKERQISIKKAKKNKKSKKTLEPEEFLEEQVAKKIMLLDSFPDDKKGEAEYKKEFASLNQIEEFLSWDGIQLTEKLLEIPPLALRYSPELLSNGLERLKKIEQTRKSYESELIKLHSKIRFVGMSVICLVHRIDAVLPDERVVLYQKCTETLLNTWHTWKLQAEQRRKRGKTEKRNRVRMEAITYWMHCIFAEEQEEQKKELLPPIRMRF